jgi:taurine dioxygenase
MTSGTTPFTLNALSDAGAAEIVGLDCARPLDDATIAAVRAAFLAHPILAIRDQHLGAAQQAAFSRRFGELEPQDRLEYTHPDDRDVLILSNEIRPDGSAVGVVDAGDFLHSDSSHHEEPVAMTILHSVRNPSRGGDTEFVNLYQVYESLPDELKREIDGKTATHHISKALNPRVSISRDRPGAAEYYAKTAREEAAVHQPIVRTHPETGRQALYVSPRFTLAIDGMEPEASEALLRRLFTAMKDPRFTYRHRWRDNDLVMWDNRCLNHRATGGYVLPDIRRMHRTTVKGGRAFYRPAA